MSERKRVLWSVLALLVLLVVTSWLLRREPEVLPVASTPSAPSPQAPAPEFGDIAPPEPTTEREVVEDAPPPAPAADLHLAHVRGRCVDEHGTAVAGCKVDFGGSQANSNRMALQGKVDWHDPEPVQTGDDGQFDIAFAPPSGMQWFLDVTAPGRVPRTGRWVRIEPDQVIDLGDIALGVGFLVAGRVIDEQGAPVARVGVNLDNLPLPLGADMAANSSRGGRTNESGAFLVTVPIPSGTWALECSGRGLRLVGPDKVVVADRDMRDLLVTVRRMPKIEGIVVDEQGLPVKGVGVEAVLNRSGSMASGRSGDDGTFTIFAVDADLKPVQLEVDDPGPCEPPAQQDTKRWPWGSTDVRLQLHRALRFELTVVEKGSGEPVTSFAVSCYSERARSSLQSDLRLSGEHPDGRATVDRVWRGSNHLKVVPLDPALLPTTLDFVAGDAGVAPMCVEVERMRPEVVVVRTVGGQPVSGSKVEIIRRGSQPLRAEEHARDIRSSGGIGSFASSYWPSLRLGMASTDAAGRAAVWVSADGAELIVRVTGAHPPTIVDPAGFVPGEELVVVVAEGAELVGKVLTDGLDPALLRLALSRGDEGEVRLEGDADKVQADGSFAMRGLEPGRYQVRLQRMVRYRTEHGSSGGHEVLELDVPEVQLEAGKQTSITIDATSMRPATVVGGLLLDGAAPPPARVFLRNQSGRSYGQFVPDDRGVFTAEGLMPGTYQVGLVVGDFVAGEGVRIIGEQTFELAAGQRVERTFTFVRRRLQLTIVEADGKTPAGDRDVRMFGGDSRSLRTDANGVLVIDPAPSDEFRLMVGSQVLGPVQMPSEKTEHSLTLTLPASK